MIEKTLPSLNADMETMKSVIFICGMLNIIIDISQYAINFRKRHQC